MLVIHSFLVSCVQYKIRIQFGLCLYFPTKPTGEDCLISYELAYVCTGLLIGFVSSFTLWNQKFHASVSAPLLQYSFVSFGLLWLHLNLRVFFFYFCGNLHWIHDRLWLQRLCQPQWVVSSSELIVHALFADYNSFFLFFFLNMLVHMASTHGLKYSDFKANSQKVLVLPGQSRGHSLNSKTLKFLVRFSDTIGHGVYGIQALLWTESSVTKSQPCTRWLCRFHLLQVYRSWFL